MREEFEFGVELKDVLLKSIISLNSVGNWSIFGKIGLHFSGTAERVVVLGIVMLLLNS